MDQRQREPGSHDAAACDDCVWVLEPGGVEYRGARELRTFVSVAMSGRTQDPERKIQITNWFADDANLCVEYTHGMNVTGTSTAGLRLRLRPGLTRYCITYHTSDGETFDRVNEYINGAV